jgi:hypothetical protein
VSNVKDSFVAFEESEKARKAEEERKTSQTQMAKTLYGNKKSTYRTKLNDVFKSLERDIQKDCKLFELEQFSDFKNLAYELVNIIVSEWYSPEILDHYKYKHGYKELS